MSWVLAIGLIMPLALVRDKLWVLLAFFIPSVDRFVQNDSFDDLLRSIVNWVLVHRSWVRFRFPSPLVR